MTEYRPLLGQKKVDHKCSTDRMMVVSESGEIVTLDLES